MSLFVRFYLYKVTLYVAPIAVSSFHFNPTGEEWTRHWAHQMSVPGSWNTKFLCVYYGLPGIHWMRNIGNEVYNLIIFCLCVGSHK